MTIRTARPKVERFKDIDRTGLIGDAGGVLWDEMKKIFCELILFKEMSGDGSVAGGYPPIWEMGNTCNYLIIWVQIYEKEKIQTNNSAKNEKIQRNNSPKFGKIQRNILKVRIITRFKLFCLEQAFEEEVGVDGDLVTAMLSDGARHAASGNDMGFAV